MRKRTIALGALAAALLAGGAWYGSLDKETRGILAALPTNADVLMWSQDQRDAAFRGMDRLPVLAEAANVAPSASPLPLPVGKPLEVPGIDQYLAQQRAAGIVIVQDGKIRLERYGLDFDAKGRWTSFSVYLHAGRRGGAGRGDQEPGRQGQPVHPGFARFCL